MGDMTKVLTDTWHQVSKPFVDTGLGRMATNVATGGLSAPAFAAYDISNGADPLKAAAGGALGYLGGDAGQDYLSGASEVPTAAGMSEQMGDWTPGAEMQPTTRSLGNMLGSETPTPEWAGGASTAPTTADNYMPLEESTGASMDTTGLNKIGGEGGWLSRMGSSAMKSMGDAWSPEGIGKSIGTMGPMAIGSGLMDMFSKNRQANAQRDRFNQVQSQINNTYAPGSPEYDALWQQLSRADAQAGRNSQYGPRSTDLAAKIAQIKLNALGSTIGNQNTMFNDSLASSGGGLGSLFAQWQKANTPRPAPAPTYNIYHTGQ